MRTSTKGIALIKDFEGFPNNGRPYQDIVGVWTRGYGRTEGIGPNSPPITEAEASRELEHLLASSYEPAVNALGLPLTQGMFDALVSFAYNVGVGALEAVNGIGRALRARLWHKAADELLRWDKAGGRSIAGLTRRRRAERRMFLDDLPVDYTRLERRLLVRPLNRRTRALLRAQARRVQLAARARPGGWHRSDRARRFRGLRDRAAQR